MKKSLVTLALAASGLSVVVQAAPLRILLVNDDGCRSPGITQLQRQLADNGYDVWLVAPAENQSGIGSAITMRMGKTFSVQKNADRQFCFPGTPADSVDFGLFGVLRDNPPDLVISGVNDGPNTGASQLNSGTVSAAARAVRFGYPAIAASIGYILTPEEMSQGWPATKKYWPQAIDYVVQVVKKLDRQRLAGQPLLPAGIGVSINYPARDKKQIAGVKVIENQPRPTPQFYYQIQPDGKVQQMMNDQLLGADNSDTDGGWLSRGWITWTLFDGQWNTQQGLQQVKKLLADPALQQP
ncbi:5'/3'-nucleotidase SurE [Erwinia sp. E602]|uniref:5'/3'-nucleotidase SurE n=1 Tax=Erwinia sp. E602 TaxID=2675378 RepID=UPI001BA7BCA0|nr:5'/3'-nucleotidase SurE [Erwinia sp. E602]QUG75735.1 5'/3'-nucleotidase SurE [Erwinia sp. E602]